MGKNKGGSHRRKSKWPIAETIADVSLVLTGVNMWIAADLNGLIMYHAAHPRDIASGATVKEYVKRALPGAVVAIGGPIAVHELKKLAPPALKRAKVRGHPVL